MRASFEEARACFHRYTRHVLTREAEAAALRETAWASDIRPKTRGVVFAILGGGAFQLSFYRDAFGNVFARSAV